MTRKNSSSVSQLVRLFRSTLSEIGREPTTEAIEAMSFLVFQAMSGRSREYHGVGHVFTVASGLPPLGRLAAIYHDTVYHQVDQGFIPAVWSKISDLGKLHDDSHFALSAKLDEKAHDVAMIFGFEPGDHIGAHDGPNEFLSAILAIRELGRYLDRKESWTIAACIEATIPFRSKDKQGRLPPEVIDRRIKRLATFRGENLSEKERSEIVRLAVRVANSDVQSFAQADVGAFLDDTWKLLPETNPEFHNDGAYSIHSYRQALSKTESFLSLLDPEVIFQQHGGVPTDRVFGIMQGRAQGNLAKGCEYLRAKIVTVSILEALADITGGDAPVSYFTGSAESGETMAYGLLPDDEALPENGFPAVDPMVLHVLTYGRMLETSFDTSRSPLSAHLYEVLGTVGINQQAERSKLVQSGQHDWRWFLDGFCQELISSIARAVAEIAVERRSKLLRIANKGLKPRKVAA